MGFVHISLAPSKELYTKVRGQVDVAGLQEDGLLLHAASELGSGEVRIVDVYADQAALERGHARMLATFESLGMGPMVDAGPQPEISETFELVR
jgi:hypothetical protein